MPRGIRVFFVPVFFVRFFCSFFLFVVFVRVFFVRVLEMRKLRWSRVCRRHAEFHAGVRVFFRVFLLVVIRFLLMVGGL